MSALVTEGEFQSEGNKIAPCDRARRHKMYLQYVGATALVLTTSMEKTLRTWGMTSTWVQQRGRVQLAWYLHIGACK